MRLAAVLPPYPTPRAPLCPPWRRLSIAPASGYSGRALGSSERFGGPDSPSTLPLPLVVAVPTPASGCGAHLTPSPTGGRPHDRTGQRLTRPRRPPPRNLRRAGRGPGPEGAGRAVTR